MATPADYRNSFKPRNSLLKFEGKRNGNNQNSKEALKMANIIIIIKLSKSYSFLYFRILIY